MSDESLFVRVLKAKGFPEEIIDTLSQVSMEDFLLTLEYNIKTYQGLADELCRTYEEVERLKDTQVLLYFKKPDGNLGFVDAGKKRIGYKTKNDLW